MTIYSLFDCQDSSCHQNLEYVTKIRGLSTSSPTSLKLFRDISMEMRNPTMKAWWNTDSMDSELWNFSILQLLVYLSLQLIISVILDLGTLINLSYIDSLRFLTYHISVSVRLWYCWVVKWVLDARFAWLNFWNPGKTLSFHERTRVPIFSNNESRISLLFYDHNRNINWYNS